MREKCFLHVRQTSFLHAGKMFFTASDSTRRKPLRGPAARARPSGRRHGLAANPHGLAADPHGLRPDALTGGRQRPGGRSCTAIKIKDDGAPVANRAPQSRRLDRRGAGLRGPCAFAHVSPPGSCSCRLLPGSGPCLCSCPCPYLGPVSLALRAAQGSPTDRHGRVGQGRTWAAHCVG